MSSQTKETISERQRWHQGGAHQNSQLAAHAAPLSGQEPTCTAANPANGHAHLLERTEVELVGVVPEEHLAVVVLVGAAGHQVQGGCGRPDDTILL